jgi:hypothetical protein
METRICEDVFHSILRLFQLSDKKNREEKSEKRERW